MLVLRAGLIDATEGRDVKCTDPTGFYNDIKLNLAVFHSLGENVSVKTSPTFNFIL